MGETESGKSGENQQSSNTETIVVFLVLAVASLLAGVFLVGPFGFRAVCDSSVLSLSTTLQIGVAIIVAYKYLYIDGHGKYWKRHTRQLVGESLLSFIVILIFAAGAERQLMIIGRGRAAECEEGHFKEAAQLTGWPIEEIFKNFNASDIFYFVTILGFLFIVLVLSRGLTGVPLLAHDEEAALLEQIRYRYGQLDQMIENFYFDQKLMFGKKGKGKTPLEVEGGLKLYQWDLKGFSKRNRLLYFLIFFCLSISQIFLVIVIQVFTDIIPDRDPGLGGTLLAACWFWVLGMAFLRLLPSGSDLFTKFAYFCSSLMSLSIAFLIVQQIFHQNEGIGIGQLQTIAIISLVVGLVVDKVFGKLCFKADHPLVLGSSFVSLLLSDASSMSKCELKKNCRSFAWKVEDLYSGDYSRELKRFPGALGIVSRHSRLLFHLREIRNNVRAFGNYNNVSAE